MRVLHEKFTIAFGCLAFILTMATPPMSAGQAKTKHTKPEAKAESSAEKPHVDLNTASEQELIDLPGIGPALAKKIIANRPYSSTSELSKASVPERTIKKITPMVTAGPSSAAASTSVPSSSKPASASTSESNATSSDASAKPAKKSAPASQVTQAAGGGSGKVWVNTKSGVYHREGDEWYGKTKQGKYMTEEEAIKAGYRVDKADKKN